MAEHHGREGRRAPDGQVQSGGAAGRATPFTEPLPDAIRSDPRGHCRPRKTMLNLINGFAVALLLTSIFALRYRYWRKPKVLALYFAFFLAIESIAAHFFLPPGAVGAEIALVCLALTCPIVAAIHFFDRRERDEDAAA